MSAYTTQLSIQGRIPPADLLQVLDNDGSGSLNTVQLNQIISDCSNAIDAMLGGLYYTPFNPVPALVSDACLCLTCYEIYKRALTPDEKNIFLADYNRYMDDKNGILFQIQTGKISLDVNTNRAFAPIVIFQCPLSVDCTTA